MNACSNRMFLRLTICPLSIIQPEYFSHWFDITLTSISDQINFKISTNFITGNPTTVNLTKSLELSKIKSQKIYCQIFQTTVKHFSHNKCTQSTLTISTTAHENNKLFPTRFVAQITCRLRSFSLKHSFKDYTILNNTYT